MFRLMELNDLKTIFDDGKRTMLALVYTYALASYVHGAKGNRTERFGMYGVLEFYADPYDVDVMGVFISAFQDAI